MLEIPVPSIITIGGFDYTVETSPRHDEELREDNKWGETSALLRRIRVTTECSAQQFNSTLLHELLHGVSNVYLPNETGLTEGQTKGMANGLFQIFRQLGISFTRR